MADRESVLLINTMVVGMKYRSQDEQGAAAILMPGDKVALVPEPDNDFDKLALKVVAHPELQREPSLESRPNGYHIGYVSKGMNAAPHRLIVAGFDLEAVVLPTNKAGEIWISISLVTDD